MFTVGFKDHGFPIAPSTFGAFLRAGTRAGLVMHTTGVALIALALENLL